MELIKQAATFNLKASAWKSLAQVSGDLEYIKSMVSQLLNIRKKILSTRHKSFFASLVMLQRNIIRYCYNKRQPGVNLQSQKCTNSQAPARCRLWPRESWIIYLSCLFLFRLEWAQLYPRCAYPAHCQPSIPSFPTATCQCRTLQALLLWMCPTTKHWECHGICWKSQAIGVHRGQPQHSSPC